MDIVSLLVSISLPSAEKERIARLCPNIAPVQSFLESSPPAPAIKRKERSFGCGVGIYSTDFQLGPPLSNYMVANKRVDPEAPKSGKWATRMDGFN